MKKIIALIFAFALVFSPVSIFAQNNNIPAGAMEKDQNKANKLARANVGKETKKRNKEAKKKQKEQQRAKKKAQREQKRRQKAMQKDLNKYKK